MLTYLFLLLEAAELLLALLFDVIVLVDAYFNLVTGEVLFADISVSLCSLLLVVVSFIMPFSSSIARKSFIISAADAVVVAFVDLFNTFVLFGAIVVDFVVLFVDVAVVIHCCSWFLKI